MLRSIIFGLWARKMIGWVGDMVGAMGLCMSNVVKCCEFLLSP
jgi:hypothetical protein